MRVYICNAFSLSMLDREKQRGHADGRREPFPIESGREWLDSVKAAFAKSGEPLEIVSVVGHADTAAVFESVLGHPVPVNRVSIKLAGAEKALIGQYIGPRLPDGATALPDGATIEWWIV